MTAVHELRFEYAKAPLSANKSYNRFQKARITREVRTVAKFLAIAARIGHHDRIEVALIWVVNDRTRRDGGENLAPTVKPMIDGLVDAGVVIDDDPSHVVRVSPIIRFEGKPTNPRAHMILRVAVLPPEATEAAA